MCNNRALVLGTLDAAVNLNKMFGKRSRAACGVTAGTDVWSREMKGRS